MASVGADDGLSGVRDINIYGFGVVLMEKHAIKVFRVIYI